MSMHNKVKFMASGGYRPIICLSADFTRLTVLARDRLQKYPEKTNMRKGTKWHMCGHNNRTGQVQLVSTMGPPPPSPHTKNTLSVNKRDVFTRNKIFGTYLSLAFHCLGQVIMILGH